MTNELDKRYKSVLNLTDEEKAKALSVLSTVKLDDQYARVMACTLDYLKSDFNGEITDYFRKAKDSLARHFPDVGGVGASLYAFYACMYGRYLMICAINDVSDIPGAFDAFINAHRQPVFI